MDVVPNGLIVLVVGGCIEIVQKTASEIRMERNITVPTALFNLVQICGYMHM